MCHKLQTPTKNIINVKPFEFGTSRSSSWPIASHPSRNFGILYEYLIHYRCEDSLCSLSGIYIYIYIWVPPNYVDCQPRTFTMFWIHSPISLQHALYFSCPFLDPHLTIYWWNGCVQIIAMWELGTSTSMKLEALMFMRDDYMTFTS